MFRTRFHSALVAGLSAVAFLAVLAWPDAAPRAQNGPEFFELKVIVVPVLAQRQLMGHFNFSPVLELEQGLQREDVAPYIARLRDAMFEDMKRYTERNPEILEQVDLARVKRVLQRAAERVTGGGMVREVLFKAVYQRSRPAQSVVPSG